MCRKTDARRPEFDTPPLDQLIGALAAAQHGVIAGRQLNDYLICVETGEVIEFNSERLRALRDEICKQHGYEPISHQFHIFGVSPQAKERKRGV